MVEMNDILKSPNLNNNTKNDRLLEYCQYFEDNPWIVVVFFFKEVIIITVVYMILLL